MSRQSDYNNQIKKLTREIGLLQHRDRFFIIGEIISFLTMIGFIVLDTILTDAAWTLVLSALSLAAYIVIRKMDVRTGEKRQQLEDLRTVYMNEIAGANGDFSCFDAGERYIDPHHPFTFDLDIFGRDSLFNRLNRTITTGGSDHLAQCLSLLHPINRSETINELAKDHLWCAKWMSFGTRMHINSNEIKRVLTAANAVKVVSGADSMLLLIIAYALITGLFVSILLSVAGLVTVNIPIWWGLLQFFGVFLLTKQALGRISKNVNTLHKQLKKYIDVIHHCADKKNIPPSAAAHFESLSEAILSFEQLNRVLNGLDRRGNILGLFLADAFFLSDFFLIRGFLKWQTAYLDRINSWINSVSLIDTWVSMATFRYNHPEAGHTEIIDSDEVVYEAKGLYHPFLGPQAVRNDFVIRDRNYYLITGANMAGKSTFLRSIGVNYVLALNGMPVFADQIRVSHFALFSSMRTTDDLTHGISYFNAELLRLQQLIDYCQRQPRTLIILDEILKGTNSLDKLNGSRLFLQAITQLPVSGIIATHDLELSKMSEAFPTRFHNYCFEIELGTAVTYTYKITPGVARNQNATFLLKQMLQRINAINLIN